jgi:transposase
MNFLYYIGIDISKATFDFCILDGTGNEVERGVADNKPDSIVSWINSIEGLVDWSRTVVCMEHSGFYGANVLQLLDNQTDGVIWLENAVQIKRSMGLQRGKDDRVDAMRIALYSLDFQRKIKIWKPSSANIERLGILISHRDRLVRSRASIALGLNEQKGFVGDDLQVEMEGVTEAVLMELDSAITLLEKKIEDLISKDGNLSRQAKIIRSIPGFGPVISSKVIEVTGGFSRLNNPRAFACYAGVAPFKHSSGSSVKGRTRVSHIANKEIKKMIHLAAMVTIRKKGIMRTYYMRKIAEGKNKMAIINAIRNKLIHILIACINKDTIYVKNYKKTLD